ncbi:reverse transcriptase domain-containing protein [Tanacetum coccineum]
MHGIKTRLYKEGAGWVEELPNVLSAHRTMPKISNGETPFSLAYGNEAVIPAEIGVPTRRTTNRTNEDNDVELRLNLNLLEERTREFVLRKNKVSNTENTGKLEPIWEGPYEVIEAYDTCAYKLRTMDKAEVPRTWH